MNQNDGELYLLVMRCQDNDNEAFQAMLLRFQPLLKKYAFLLNYSDAYMDVYDGFIDCIYKIPLAKLKVSENDSIVLAYIKTCMKNTYITLSKKNGQQRVQTSIEDLDFQKQCLNCYQVDYEDYLFEENLKSILNEKEKVLIFAKFVYGYSETEVANRWTIVNKKDTIFKYIFWEWLDSLPIPESCFHFVWCQIA